MRVCLLWHFSSWEVNDTQRNDKSQWMVFRAEHREESGAKSKALLSWSVLLLFLTHFSLVVIRDRVLGQTDTCMTLWLFLHSNNMRSFRQIEYWLWMPGPHSWIGAFFFFSYWQKKISCGVTLFLCESPWV